MQGFMNVIQSIVHLNHTRIQTIKQGFAMFNYIQQRKIIITCLCSILLVLPVHGQDNWWEKAKNLLKEDDNISQLAVSDQQIGKALKQALSVGTESVISTLQQRGAFANNPQLHIDLPSSLATVSKALDKVGMGHWTNELEAKLNQAAEQAIPAAGPILLDAINQLTLEDVQGIYQGENDAATQYFKAHMSAPIAQAMEPIIQRNLEDVGALSLYEKIIAKYQSLPFVPDVSSDLITLVKTEALSGIFTNLAKEEAAIRENPEKRTTDLLKQVFSQ
jgi:hypothetical protein